GTWYAKGRSHHPATGFLEERVRNIRKQLRRSSRGHRPQREQDTVPSRIVIPEPAPKLFETWVPLYADKIIHLAKREGKLALPEEQINLDARGEVALMLPPVMLPPPVYKQGRTLVCASVEESKRFFIDVKPVGTNMVEYLEQAKSSRSCPFVLLLQDWMLCSQAFVVISGKAIETETALAAVDTCFKSFYVFDINYTNQCLPTWQFFQDVVYELEGTVSPAVKFLKTQIHACK
ncbi:hypothetical protein KUCAC02_006177, partial [Chaenocephalus aceratus]